MSGCLLRDRYTGKPVYSQRTFIYAGPDCGICIGIPMKKLDIPHTLRHNGMLRGGVCRPMSVWFSQDQAPVPRFILWTGTCATYGVLTIRRLPRDVVATAETTFACRRIWLHGGVFLFFSLFGGFVFRVLAKSKLLTKRAISPVISISIITFHIDKSPFFWYILKQVRKRVIA